jgi:hypothetical protein
VAGSTFADKERAAKDKKGVAVVAPPVARTPTLTVGHAFDPAEADADRVADSVIEKLRSGETDEHRHTAACDHGVQRAAEPAGGAEVGMAGGELSSGLSGAIESRRGRGSALPSGVRRRMESAFGQDLGNVSIHTDQQSATLNQAVSARAFTTGNDIFFGAGQFRPDTPAGEHMLAHELAHTVQQRNAIGRKTINRLWDFSRPVDWGKLKSISTITSGQAIFMFKDTDGDEAVIKSEDSRIGFAGLAGDLHDAAGGSKSVSHTKLSDDQKAAAIQLIHQPDKWDRDSLSKLGKAKRADSRWYSPFEKQSAAKGVDAATVSDFEIGMEFWKEYLGFLKNNKWMAMSKAQGVRAQEASSKKKDDDVFGTQQATRFRRSLSDWKHNVSLGQLTAVDLFLGNGDRVMMGNMGNWFYDDIGHAMTLIDHVDTNVGSIAGKGTVKHGDMEKLKKDNLAKTAKEALSGLSIGVKDPSKGNDPDFDKWLDANKGVRRDMIEEGLEEGLKIGRERLIKIFSATRFSGKKSDRALKKNLKASAVKAAGLDAEDDDNAKDPTHYYEVLKKRALWLKKN